MIASPNLETEPAAGPSGVTSTDERTLGFLEAKRSRRYRRSTFWILTPSQPRLTVPLFLRRLDHVRYAVRAGTAKAMPTLPPDGLEDRRVDADHLAPGG